MMLQRSTFLTLSAAVALSVGCFALAFPRALLESKGVAPTNDAAAVWVREVGVTIIAQGAILLLIRKHADSATLRAIFVGSAMVQLGLFPIELVAYRERVITLVSGIVPNSVLHLVLASGFLVFAARMKAPVAAREQTAVVRRD